LILTPGASPVIPPIPGIERGIALCATVEDVEKIAASVIGRAANKCCWLIGGGLIGVEIAESLVHRKKSNRTSLKQPIKC